MKKTMKKLIKNLMPVILLLQVISIITVYSLPQKLEDAAYTYDWVKGDIVICKWNNGQYLPETSIMYTYNWVTTMAPSEYDDCRNEDFYRAAKESHKHVALMNLPLSQDAIDYHSKYHSK